MVERSATPTLSLPAAAVVPIIRRYSVANVPLPERLLTSEIRRMAGPAHPRAQSRGPAGRIVRGIGDDCAILSLPPGHELLVTTDFSLEGIHFRRDWHPPDSVGHRCLTRGLSDIAAMGGEPLAAFLSLAVPPQLPQSWIREFIRGFMRLAQRFGITLAGGDTAESPDGVLADIVVVGGVPKGKAVLRSGARSGDRIFVSGDLGGSAAAVLQMNTGGRKVSASRFPRHFYPEPRIALGQILRKKKLATAMIDTSDGLSTDLSHLCEESGVGAEIDPALIPRARVGAKPVGLDLALHGGEDYELLFTVPAGQQVPSRLAGVRLTQIGRITRSRGIMLRDTDGRTRRLRAMGWEHFRT